MSFTFSALEMELMFDGSPNGLLVFRRNESGDYICQRLNDNFIHFTEFISKEKVLGQNLKAVFGDTLIQVLNVTHLVVSQKRQSECIVTIQNQNYKVVVAPIVEDEEVVSLVIALNPSWRFSPQFYGNQKLLDSMHDAVFIFDVAESGEYHLSYLNETHQNLTGLNIIADFGKNPVELTDEVQGKIIRDRYDQCVTEKKTIQYEEKLTLPSGTRWWETKISPVIIGEKVVQIIGTARDITKEKQYTEERDALLQEYKNVFDYNLAPMALYEVNEADETFRLVRHNRACENQTGLINSEYTGKRLVDMVDDASGPKVRRYFLECFHSKQPVSYEEDLTMLGVTRHWSTMIAPVIHDDKVERIIVSSLDITDRQAHEDEIQSLLDEYMTVFDATQSVKWVDDYDEATQTFRVNKINQQYTRATGFSIDEVKGKTIFETTEEPHSTEIWKRHMDCVMSKRAITFEESVVVGNRTGYFMTTLAPIFKDSRVIQVVGSSIDITELKEKEKKVQSLLDEYMTVFDSTQTVMWVNDYDAVEQSFRVNKINRQYTVETGVSLEEIKGKTVYETSVEPNSTLVWNRHMECVRQKTSMTYEEEIEFGNRIGTFITTYAPIIKNGKVVQVAGSSMDITKIKENEKKVQALLDEYMAVFDAAQTVMWVNDYDEIQHTFRINKINQQYVRETGVQLEEVRGKTIFETSVEPHSTEIWQHHMECVNQKESITYEETPVVGNRKGVYLTTLAPIIEQGKVVQVVGSSVDITAIRKQEEQIQSLLDEYRTVFDTTQTVMWVADVDEDKEEFRMNRFNQLYVQQAGEKAYDFIGKKIEETVDETSAAVIHQNHLICMREKKPYIVEESISVGDYEGTTITSYSPIIRDGKVIQIVASSSDITELKAYQKELTLQKAMLAERVEERTAELRKALVDKDAFLSAMSEEISSPVSAIQGFSELLRRLSSKDSANYRYIDQIYRYSQTLSSRFGELMSVVSVHENWNELDYQTIDLEQRFRAALNQFNIVNGVDNIELVQQYNLPTRLIWMDVKRTQLIIDNICEVAFQRLKNGGKFKVVVSHQDEGRQLRFKFDLWINPADSEHAKHGSSHKEPTTVENEICPNNSFNLDIMLVERAVEVLRGTMLREWNEEERCCRTVIELPILQHQD